jgi:hypothetical protein
MAVSPAPITSVMNSMSSRMEPVTVLGGTS